MKLKSILLMSFVIGIIAILSLSGAFAVSDKNKSDNQMVGNDSDEHGCKPSTGYSWCAEKEKCIRSWEENCTANNMTFGGCVSDSAKIKNICYSQTKEQLKSCLLTAKNQTDSTLKKSGKKQCIVDYKISLKTCKADFKSAKKECQKIKHNFFEKVKSLL